MLIGVIYNLIPQALLARDHEVRLDGGEEAGNTW